jgi:putative endonuclease
MEWWVYIVRCADNSLYCGIAIDPQKRTEEHNQSKKGAAYTKSRRPVELVWKEKAANKSQALKREAEIKKMTKENKEIMIAAASSEIEVFSADFKSSDPNIQMLWYTLQILDHMGLKPIMWKLDDEFIESVSEYLDVTKEQAAKGKLWDVPVDMTSSFVGIVSEKEFYPILKE